MTPNEILLIRTIPVMSRWTDAFEAALAVSSGRPSSEDMKRT